MLYSITNSQSSKDVYHCRNGIILKKLNTGNFLKSVVSRSKICHKCKFSIQFFQFGE